MTKTKTNKLARICFCLSFETAADTKAAAKLLKKGRAWRVVDLTIPDDEDGDLNAVYMARVFLSDGGETKDNVIGEFKHNVLPLLPGLTPNRVRYAISGVNAIYGRYYDI